jgi:hypothetical protein
VSGAARTRSGCAQLRLFRLFAPDAISVTAEPNVAIERKNAGGVAASNVWANQGRV